MRSGKYQKGILTCVALTLSLVTAFGQRPRAAASLSPANTLLKIIRYEDQRNWNDELKALLTDQDAHVRQRATLAAGRIGEQAAVPLLAEMLLTDRDDDVRRMAAFALGEIESPGGGYALLQVLKSDRTQPAVRARAVEALGKISAVMIANPPAAGEAGAPKDERLDIFRAAILDALKFEDSRRAQADRLTVLLGLTAVLRAKPDNAGSVVTKFLDYPDARVVADALNTMARLRLKDANERVRQLL